MPWTWRYEQPDGTEHPDPPDSLTFANQSDAESWLGEHWRELADADVAQVSLFEDDQKKYGPMALAEE